LHGSYIRALNIVFELSNLLLELIQGDFFIFNDQSDLELLDTIADRNQFTVAPNQTILLDRADGILQSLHIRLIIPRLDLERHNRLGDSLRLVGFLCVVGSNTLGLDSLGLSIVFVIGAKEVDIVIVLGSGSRSSLRTAYKGLTGLAGAGERIKLSGIGLDVIVPPRRVGGRWGLREELEEVNISLRWSVPVELDSVGLNQVWTSKRIRKPGKEFIGML
jgi:hypothetical protein